MTCIYHHNCNCDMILRDDARLVPCDNHLWAMDAIGVQQLFTLQKTHAGQLGPDFLTNNPGNIHKVTNCIVMEIFMP